MSVLYLTEPFSWYSDSDLIAPKASRLLARSPGTRRIGPSRCAVSGHVTLVSAPVTGDAFSEIRLEHNSLRDSCVAPTVSSAVSLVSTLARVSKSRMVNFRWLVLVAIPLRNPATNVSFIAVSSCILLA